MAEYKRPGNTGRKTEWKPGRKPEHKKEWGSDRKSGWGSDRSADGSTDRKPYGDRDHKPYGDKDRKPFGGADRKPYGDKDRKPYGDRDRKPYGDTDRKTYGDRDRKPYGGADRKPYGDRDRKPYGGEDRKPYGDKDRKPYGGADRKPYGENDRKPYGDRDRKPYSSADRKPYGDKDRKPYGSTDRKPYRSFDRKPESDTGWDQVREPAGFKDRKPYGSTDRKPPKTFTKSIEKKPDLLAGQKPDNQLADSLDKLEGRNSVMEAIKSGRSINRLLVSKGEKEGSINQIIALARQNHIIIQEVERSKLDEMSETHAHQGIIALTSPKDYVEVDDILKAAAESGRPPFIIILDEITDAYNLGSILRTSNAAGVHGVIIPKRRAVGLTSVVSKASAGAIEYVPVARVTNIVQTIEYLKTKNIWVAGTDSTGEKPYYDHDLTGGVALVIGSEGEGMGKLVREACDFTVNIPMLGDISSLNAAVAGAIVIYDIVRQRNMKQH